MRNGGPLEQIRAPAQPAPSVGAERYVTGNTTFPPHTKLKGYITEVTKVTTTAHVMIDVGGTIVTETGLEEAGDALELLLGDERAYVRVGIEAWPEPDLAGLGRQALDHLVEHALMRIEPRAGAAALAMVEDDGAG